jgi:methylphosphotriester-DNA--protein-cysteine methyltransferase
MIPHLALGDIAFTRSRKLKLLIDNKQVQFGGNAKLKIYGTLQCKSGKRMKPQNRVFFTSEAEAIGLGYRPCGHCMINVYKKWKTANSV